MGEAVGDGVGNGKLAARAAGRRTAHMKWPIQVRTMKKGVMQGYRQLVLPDRRFRFFWRSLKGRGFWVTAKDFPVFEGRTLAEATLRLAAHAGVRAE